MVSEGCDRRVTWVPFTVFLSLGDKDNSLGPYPLSLQPRVLGHLLVFLLKSFRLLALTVSFVSPSRSLALLVGALRSSPTARR